MSVCDGYILSDSRHVPWLGLVTNLNPTNLPRRFRCDGLQVFVTFRLLDKEKGRCGPTIRVITIEEAIYTSHFFVREYNDCFLLVEDREHMMLRIPTNRVLNLPKEYRRDGIRVKITYRYRMRHNNPCPLPPYHSYFGTIEIYQ